jgi:hypothetical protein
VQPDDGATLTTDPTLRWQPVRGADRYRVYIFQGATAYSYAYTNYTCYSPYAYASGSRRTLPNGDYSWTVEAYSGNTLLTTSGTRTFSKASGFGLLAPSDGGASVADPALGWQALGGANKYKVLISKGGQSTAYATSYYTSYTPYAYGTGSVKTLPDGAYDWWVEAYNDSTLLTTSGTRSFIRASSLTLVEPAEGQTLAGDPTLRWQAVRGANKYKLLISKDGSLYGYATTYYTAYTPYYYASGSVETLANGSYSWRVEAYLDSTLITTSPTRAFTVSAGAPTATPTPTATGTKTPVPTATPSSPDGFEADNGCAEAKEVIPGGLPQTHNFHVWGDQDWVRFNATAGKSYVVQTSNSGPKADPVLLLYNVCDSPSLDGADNAFGSDLSVEWNAEEGGWYYLKLQQHDADVYGSGTNYDLSVTVDATPPGAPRNVRCASVSLDTIAVQ